MLGGAGGGVSGRVASLRRGRGADGSDPAEGEVARAAADAARGVGPEAAAALSSLASLRSGGNTPGGAAIASADRAAVADCRRLTHGQRPSVLFHHVAVSALEGVIVVRGEGGGRGRD